MTEVESPTTLRILLIEVFDLMRITKMAARLFGIAAVAIAVGCLAPSEAKAQGHRGGGRHGGGHHGGGHHGGHHGGGHHGGSPRWWTSWRTPRRWIPMAGVRLWRGFWRWLPMAVVRSLLRCGSPPARIRWWSPLVSPRRPVTPCSSQTTDLPKHDTAPDMLSGAAHAHTRIMTSAPRWLSRRAAEHPRDPTRGPRAAMARLAVPILEDGLVEWGSLRLGGGLDVEVLRSPLRGYLPIERPLDLTARSLVLSSGFPVFRAGG